MTILSSHKYKIISTFLLFLSVVLLAPPSRAQRAFTQNTFSGRITDLACGTATGQVYLRPRQSAGLFAPSVVRLDGSFVFSPTPPEGNIFELQVYCGRRLMMQRLCTRQELEAGVDLHAPQDHRERPVSGIVDVTQLSRQPDRAARKSFSRGLRASRRGDNERAIKLVRQALEQSPGWVEASHELGTLYTRAGRYGEAVVAFRSVAQALPESAGSWSNLAIALWGAGELDDAARAFERSLSLDPNRPTIRREAKRLQEFRRTIAAGLP